MPHRATFCERRIRACMANGRAGERRSTLGDLRPAGLRSRAIAGAAAEYGIAGFAFIAV